ncbi:MAG: FAD-dependent oxidoreductase, partial [Actinomycetota bacterium]
MNNVKADIVIIVAGITGCAIARQLGKYKSKVLVIEKESDASCGTTKVNSGLVHPGYAGEKGTLR